MTIIHPLWGSDSTTALNGTSITNGSTNQTDEIQLDGVSTLEVGVECVYGNPANNGLKIYVLKLVKTGTYEAVTDDPIGLEMPYAVSATRRRTFAIDGRMASNIKILAKNDTGATVTVTVTTRVMQDEAL